MSYYDNAPLLDDPDDNKSHTGISLNEDFSKLESKTYTIPADEEYRPDKVSASIYDGNTELDWVISNANKFTHEIADYYVGRTIIYPIPAELEKLGIL